MAIRNTNTPAIPSMAGLRRRSSRLPMAAPNFTLLFSVRRSANLRRVFPEQILERLGSMIDEGQRRTSDGSRGCEVVERGLVDPEMRLVTGVAEAHVDAPKALREAQ